MKSRGREGGRGRRGGDLLVDTESYLREGQTRQGFQTSFENLKGRARNRLTPDAPQRAPTGPW